MELRQLTFVLHYVVDAIADRQLPARYERLAAALEAAALDETAVAAVQTERAALYAAQRAVEPVGWDAARLDLLARYGARPLLGEPVVARLNAAFVEHFMAPQEVVRIVRRLGAQTADLDARSRQLLAGLTPLLTAEPAESPALEGEIIDPALPDTLRVGAPAGGVWQLVRTAVDAWRPNAGNRLPVLHSSSRLPVKELAAAAPLVVAAAAKALDLYRHYQEGRRAVAPIRPTRPTVLPAAEPRPIRFAVTQTIFIVDPSE